MRFRDLEPLDMMSHVKHDEESIRDNLTPFLDSIIHRVALVEGQSA